MKPLSDSAERIALGFVPLHKRALGTAVGIATGTLVFLITAIPLLRGKADELPLVLLAQYFNGYRVSWAGAFIGAAWAGFVGFVLGWFLAFCSNFLLAIRLLTLRARTDYQQTRDFLDQI